MKRTSSINLGGMIFNIDEDAYQKLNHYFTELSGRFPEDEKDEILRDIESRMAELFTFKLQNRDVIEINDVDEVIDVIGHPNQFDDEGGQSTSDSRRNNAQARKEYRKLYRDSTNKIIGGVAAGLGAYFNIDPVIMRILFVVIAFASLGWGILIYLIFLIAMPEATTKAQLLEMQGIQPSLENIDNFSQATNEPQGRNNNTLGSIIKFILIVIGIVVAITFAICFIGICIAIFITLLTHTPGGFGNFTDIALLVSCALFCLCPVIGIVVLCVRALKNGERRQKWVGWTLLAIWILSLFGIIGFGIETGRHGNVEQRLEKTGQQIDNWFDDDTYVGYHNDADDVDDIIEPILDDLDNENDYDISIQSNPVSGTSVHIKGTKKGKQNLAPNDTISM